MSNAPTPPTPTNPDDSRTWYGSLLAWDFSTSNSRQQARYESLHREGQQDVLNLNESIHGGLGAQGLNAIRNTDVDPAVTAFLTAATPDLTAIHDLETHVGELSAAAQANPDPTNALNIHPAFWTTALPELGNQTPEDYVTTEIIPRLMPVAAFIPTNRWRRGGSIQQEIVRAANAVNNLSSPMHRPTTILRMQETSGGVESAATRMQDEYDRVNGSRMRESQHNPDPAIAAEYITWHGDYDANRPQGQEWNGVMGTLQSITTHRFWQLPHSLGRNPPPTETIAQRAQAIFDRLNGTTHMEQRPGHPLSVQNMGALQRDIDGLLIDMRTASLPTQRPNNLGVPQGSDQFESEYLTSRRLRQAIAATAAGLLALLGGAVATSGNKAPTQDVSIRANKDGVRSIDIGGGATARAVDTTTIIVTMPDGTTPANFVNRVFQVGPGGKEPNMYVTPVYKGEATWALTIPAALQGEKAIRLKYTGPHESGVVAELGQVDVPIPGATGMTASTEKLPELMTISENCKLQVYPPKTLVFSLSPDTTAANLKTKYIIAIYQKGTPKHRLLPLVRTERGWEADLTDDEVRAGIELYVGHERNGVMVIVANKTPVPLEK